MRINITSVLVDDQDKALAFYTDVLGFVKKCDRARPHRDSWQLSTRAVIRPDQDS